MGALHKVSATLRREVGALQQGFDIAANTAYGGAQFVGDVIAHFLLEFPVLLGTRYIAQSHLETTVAVHQELYGIIRTASVEVEAEDRCLFGNGAATTI
ncbi:hypothetical protein EVA_10291 [gut metagenome]|uniref:Uncharacterized protein n=1 Tax=gut metagenome TaxID=749906 RepID=J9G438_9ZZZZ